MTPTPPQATPVSTDEKSLFAKVWWLFLNAVRDAIAALQAGDYVYGGQNLVDVNRLVKVLSAKTVTESSITDDGSSVTFTEQLISSQGAAFSGTVQAVLLNGTSGVEYNGLAFQPTVALHLTGRNSTLTAQNLRQGAGVLVAGTYRVGVVFSFTPTGSATIASTLAWTDDIGSSLTQGLSVTSASPLPVQETLTVNVDGTHDLTLAVPTVTGTVTYNVKVVLEHIA